MRRVLARRDMRLYVIAQTLSMFGDTALWLALAVWAKSLTGSSAAAGMVIFGITAPGLFAPLSGLLADRVRRRPLVIVTNLLTAVAVLPLLLVHDRGDVWIIYAVTLAYGFSFTVLGAGLSGLLATMLPEDELADANGVLQTVARGAAVVRAAGRRRPCTPRSAAPRWRCSMRRRSLIAAGAAGDDARRGARSGAAQRAPPGRDRRWGAPPAPDHPAAPGHLWRRGVALLVIGFSETLTFEVAGRGLGRDPSFVGVLLSVQGIGAVAGAATAAALVRRFGEGFLAGAGMLVFSLGVSAADEREPAGRARRDHAVRHRHPVDRRRAVHAAPAADAGAAPGPHVLGHRGAA